MKKNIALFTTLLVIAYLTLTSYKKGAATHGFDCTGAETSNNAGCYSGGNGCHSTSAHATIAVSIELDSAGIATTRYVPGMAYTVTIKGINNGTTTQKAFGFQMGCIQDTISQASPVNEGTWITANLPVSTHYMAASTSYAVNLVEQSASTFSTTGTGGNGTTYVKTFSWIAPAAGTGYISFWGVLNAVNADGNASSADLWNTTKLIISERVCNQPTTSSITQSVCSGYNFFGNYYTASGNYTVLTTNHFNCDSIISLQLNILQPSNAAVSQSVCKNDSFNFYGTYLKSSGTYTHHLTNYLGCDSLITMHFTVNPVNKSVNVSGGTLSAATNTTYQWLDCNNGNAAIAGATNQTFTPTVSGSYAVALTTNGCADTSFCYTVTVTGVDNITASALQLYPNPASTELRIRNYELGIEEVEITNLVGQHCFPFIINNSSFLTIDLHTLPSGIYFIKTIDSNGKMLMGKFVKE